MTQLPESMTTQGGSKQSRGVTRWLGRIDRAPFPHPARRKRQPCGIGREAIFEPMYGRSLCPPIGRFYSCRLMASADKEPPLSRQGSRLAILVYQGSDPTQPYPTLVIRAERHTFPRLCAYGDMIRRCSAPRPDGHYVGSASPDSGDITRFTSSLAKTAGRIVSSRRWSRSPRFWTRASSSARAAASSRYADGEAGPPRRRGSARADQERSHAQEKT